MRKGKVSKRDRAFCLSLAASTVYDTPAETVARADAYLNFYAEGQVPKKKRRAPAETGARRSCGPGKRKG